MTKLLPELREKKPSYDARGLAKIRTLTALRALDSERNSQLVGFLREAKLIGEEPSKAPKIDFKNANLSGANLKSTDLSGVNLSAAILAGADLSGAKLISANLSKADLTDAKLEGANFSNANLIQADLRQIEHITANFCGAMLAENKKSSQGCSAYVAASAGLLLRDSPGGYAIGSRGYGAVVTLAGKTAYVGGRNWSLLTSGGWVASSYLSIRPPENTPSPAPSNN